MLLITPNNFEAIPIFLEVAYFRRFGLPAKKIPKSVGGHEYAHGPDSGDLSALELTAKMGTRGIRPDVWAKIP